MPRFRLLAILFSFGALSLYAVATTAAEYQDPVSGAKIETDVEIPRYLYHWTTPSTVRRITAETHDGSAWTFPRGRLMGVDINWSLFFQEDRRRLFVWSNRITGMAASPVWEEYGEALLRIEIDPKARALHVIDGGTQEFVPPSWLNPKNYDLLLREDPVTQIREWIILNPQMIRSYTSDPDILGPLLNDELLRIKRLGERFPRAELHTLNFNPATNPQHMRFAEGVIARFLTTPNLNKSRQFHPHKLEPLQDCLNHEISSNFK